MNKLTDLTKEQLIKKVLKLEKDFESFKKANPASTLELGKDTGKLLEFSGILNQRFAELEKTLENVSRTGATFAKGGQLTKSLSDTIKELDLLIASGKEGAAAFRALTNGFEQFEKLSRIATDGTKNLAGELATQSALLAQLGLSYGSFQKNLDLAIFSFGQNAAGVQSLNLQIKSFADSVGMLPETVSRNFQTVARNLAYDFGKIKEQFVGIQKVSAQTGVSVDTLLGKFGQPMDTISGASEMAARMNALLGRNAFSAAQLLMMSEEDRMNMFREVVGTDQNIGASLRSDNQVERKFALQSVAAAMGMDVDTARRFLEGGDLDSVKRKMAEEQGAFNRGGALQDFKEPATDLTKALRELTNIIRRDQMDVSERMLVSARENQLRTQDGRGSAKAQSLQAGGLLQTLGPMPAGLDVNEAVRAMTEQVQVRDILAMLQAGVIKDPKARQRAITTIQRIAEGRGDALDNMNILNAIKDQAVKASDITMEEMVIISKASQNFGLRRRLLEAADNGLLTDNSVSDIQSEIDKQLGIVTVPPPLTPPVDTRRTRTNVPTAGAKEVTNVKVMIGNQVIDNKFVKVLVEKLREVFE